jgi:hypothetical protein
MLTQSLSSRINEDYGTLLHPFGLSLFIRRCSDTIFAHWVLTALRLHHRSCDYHLLLAPSQTKRHDCDYCYGDDCGSDSDCDSSLSVFSSSFSLHGDGDDDDRLPLPPLPHLAPSSPCAQGWDCGWGCDLSSSLSDGDGAFSSPSSSSSTCLFSGCPHSQRRQSGSETWKERWIERNSHCAFFSSLSGPDFSHSDSFPALLPELYPGRPHETHFFCGDLSAASLEIAFLS